jgi:hypothetical protein
MHGGRLGVDMRSGGRLDSIGLHARSPHRSRGTAGNQRAPALRAYRCSRTVRWPGGGPLATARNAPRAPPPTPQTKPPPRTGSAPRSVSARRPARDSPAAPNAPPPAGAPPPQTTAAPATAPRARDSLRAGHRQDSPPGRPGCPRPDYSSDCATAPRRAATPPV